MASLLTFLGASPNPTGADHLSPKVTSSSSLWLYYSPPLPHLNIPLCVIYVSCPPGAGSIPESAGGSSGGVWASLWLAGHGKGEGEAGVPQPPAVALGQGQCSRIHKIHVKRHPGFKVGRQNHWSWKRKSTLLQGQGLCLVRPLPRKLGSPQGSLRE